MHISLATYLDFLVHLVITANIRYVSEVEEIISLASVVLQNQAYAGGEMTDNMEKLSKNSGSGRK